MEPLTPDSAPAFFVLATLRRYWRMILAITLVAGVLAGAYAAATPAKYTSSSTVQLKPLLGNAYSPDTVSNPTVALQTEAELVPGIKADVEGKQNNQILTYEEAADKDAGKSPAEPAAARVKKYVDAISGCDASGVTATVLTNAQLIKISYTGRTATGAQECARAFATTYAEYRTALAGNAQQSQTVKLNRAANRVQLKLQEAQNEITALQNTIANKQSSAADVQVAKTNLITQQTTAQQLTSQLSAIENQIGQVASAVTSATNIVVNATRPTSPDGISPILLVIAGVLVGLVLGALIAIFRGRRDRRILTETDSDLLGLPVLATVLTARNLPTGMPLPPAATDEEFRMAAISVLANPDSHRTIAVSPLSDNESSAAVAIRLARAIAASGYTVVLVDAVVSGPQVGDLLDVQPQVGLSDILDGAGFDTVSLFELDGVEVLTAGTDPFGSRQRHSGARIGELLEKLKQAADFVLISTSPVSAADGLGVLLAADEAVIVADDHATTYEKITEVKSVTRRLGVGILGLIVARVGKASSAAIEGSTRRGAEVDQPDAGGRRPALRRAGRATPELEQRRADSDDDETSTARTTR